MTQFNGGMGLTGTGNGKSEVEGWIPHVSSSLRAGVGSNYTAPMADQDPTPSPQQPVPESVPARDARSLWRGKLHEIIFEADTPMGKFFDVLVLLAIMASVLVVMLESVEEINKQYGEILVAAEWFFTILFTIEYLLRLVCVARARAYAFSFFGIVDLLAILPTYISVLIPGAQSLVVVRALRLLRVFRVFKLGYFLSEAADLRKAVWDSRAKIVVFLATVIIVVVIVGSAMHLIEGSVEDTKFTSIPQSVYWAIVTMTTVGFGDITPQTALGKMLASCLIIIGYSLIIVPTGFVSAELVDSRVKAERARQASTKAHACPSCMREGHDRDAKCCKYCGEDLHL